MGGTRGNWLFVWVGSAMLAVAGTTSAQEPEEPAPPQESAPDEEDFGDDIIVTAEPGDQVRIDRRIYAVRSDPIAQSTSMLDVLARIPSVTVAPSGAIRLLGADDVTIQIDGQTVPGASLDQVLRSLTGAEVERIEVITYPSAQYSAQSSGGIINILSRERFEIGFTGSLTASADSAGAYQFNISPTWTRTPWSFGGRLGLNKFTWEGANEREREQLSSGLRTSDIGGWQGDGSGGWGGLFLNYRPNDRRRASVRANGNVFDSDTESFLSRSSDFEPEFAQAVANASNVANARLSFDGQQSGDSAGEVFKLNANLSSFRNENNSVVDIDPADASPGRRYATANETDTRSANAKFDYERPIGDMMLTAGLALDRADHAIDTALETLAGAPIAPDYASRLRGVETTLAGYLTYQVPLGDWTLLPGVRLEQYRREVRSLGGESDAVSNDAFPSLHLRRNLGEGIDLDLSYSRRIARPALAQLDPAIRYAESDRANTGNPDLAPTMTNALEANFTYERDQRSYSVTLFDRLSEDVVSNFTETTLEGVILTMPVNAGESRQRGLQLIARAPLFAPGWRYSLSANLLSRAFDVLQGGVLSNRSELEYSGAAQVEYRERNQSDPGADHLQLELQFQGPQFYLQGERDAFVTANFTWRRRLNDRLSSVLSVQDMFDSAANRSELRTAEFFERSESRGVGTRVRLALTYQFGSVQRGEAPDAGGAPPAPPEPQ